MFLIDFPIYLDKLNYRIGQLSSFCSENDGCARSKNNKKAILESMQCHFADPGQKMPPTELVQIVRPTARAKIYLNTGAATNLFTVFEFS